MSMTMMMSYFKEESLDHCKEINGVLIEFTGFWNRYWSDQRKKNEYRPIIML
jgi:hypothetical protein